MRLQYQMANGRWADCNDGVDDSTEEFINYCIETTGLNRDEVIEKLASGEKVPNDSDDWYDVCRCEEAHQREINKKEHNHERTVAKRY